MSNLAADHLRKLLPAIMERWDERARAEVSAAEEQDQAFLRDHLVKMLEVLAKIRSSALKYVLFLCYAMFFLHKVLTNY